MGKIFTGRGWIIRVHGDEHPPIHAHVIHPDGKVMIEARAWIMANREAIENEWEAMNNPRKR